MIYWDLFLGFLQVGLFSFGGAYGAIPLIRDVVLDYGWLSVDALSYMIAISESTPGPIMVNLATYVGSSQGGLLGAVIATTAVVLPAYLVIILLTVLLKTLFRNAYFQALLQGLKLCITGIILATGTQMVLVSCQTTGAVDWKALCITSALSAVLFGSKYGFKKKVSPICLILIAAGLGITMYGI